MKRIFLTVTACLFFQVVVFAQNENPHCPKVSVTTSDMVVRVESREPMIFTASVKGKPEDLKVEYIWTVSAGKIVEGQGTPIIKIDVAGLVNQEVEATVEIKGLPENCVKTASETNFVARMVYDNWFGGYGKISRLEEAARLDSIVAQLQNSSDVLVGFDLSFKGKPTDKQINSRISRIVKNFIFLRALNYLNRVVFFIEDSKEEYTNIYFVLAGTENDYCNDCKIIKGSDIDLSKFLISKRRKK